MALQILRYGALALVSFCLVMIALVVSGLVPLQAVRNTMAKVPALVQVAAEKPSEEEPVAVARVDQTGSGTENSTKTVGDGESKPAESGETNDSGSAEETTAKIEDGSMVGADSEAETNRDKSREANPEAEDAKESDAPEVADAAFDILRVEKDGSIVVAGRAAPGSNVELRTSDGRVLGSSGSGSSGDFVIVLDEPLAAGNYSLSLVVVGSDGTESVSSETATVSVPKEQDGDVLAMVTKAGEASRILAKPETLQSGDPQKEEVGEETSVARKPENTGEDDSGAQLTEGEAESKATEKQMASSGTENAASESQQEDTAAKASDGRQEQKTAALDPQSDQETDSAENREEPQPNEVGEAENQEADKESAQQVVVRVEAVEIESDQIFIAGEATQGSAVRIYIDGKPIGETRGTVDNRFLVTRRFALEPGEHTIRADSIDNATGKVVARAEVPLLHEPIKDVAEDGSDESAVETRQVAEDEDKPASAVDETDLALAKTGNGQEAEAEKAPEAVSQTVQPSLGETGASDDSKQSAGETAATAEEQSGTTSQTDQSDVAEGAAGEKVPDESGERSTDQQVALTDPERGTPKDSEVAVSEGDTKTEEGEPAQSDSSKEGTAGAQEAEKVAKRDHGDETEQKPATTLKPADSQVEEAPEVESENVGREPTEVATAEPSKEVGNDSDGTIRTGTSIIIRPGDTLWQISRKSYGRGIRYTTIYKANRDQIRDPHWIYIGQIFRIPDRPDEELVEADG